jgi:hypothetical protein
MFRRKLSPPVSGQKNPLAMNQHEQVAANSLQPPAHAGSLLADSSALKLEAIISSETSVHTRSTRRHIPEDGIFLFLVNFVLYSFALDFSYHLYSTV